MYKCASCDYQVENPETPCPNDGGKRFVLVKGKEVEHKLTAYQCSDCKYEFVIVNLNKAQLKSEDDDPNCPECADSSTVNPIDCLDIRLIENVQQYQITKNVKQLPE